MRNIICTSLLFIFALGSQVSAQPDKPAYLLFNDSGNQISYESFTDTLLQQDLIFFGEQHNNAIAHWLQFELIRDLSADSSTSLMIGMEMFEADQQLLIDEYFQDQISQNSFESEARLWNNYQTDYKPILEFAKKNRIPLIATNIPRRYASAVYSSGLSALDSLSQTAKEWVAPIPVEVDTSLQSYRNMAQMAHGHGGVNLIHSQAVKDATMAHFILMNLHDNSRMIHLNGSYHSNDHEGIIWYIRQNNETLDLITINTISVENLENVEIDQLQSADFTLAVPSTMTTTY